MRPGRALQAALGVLLVVAAGAPAALAEEAEVMVVPFDIQYEDIRFADKMKAEIAEFYVKAVGKAGARVLPRGERDRVIFEKRILVLSAVDKARGDEIARQAGWRRHVTARIKGVKGNRVEITVTYSDLDRPDPEGVVRTLTVPNHLKAVRDGLAVATEAVVKQGLAAGSAASTGAAPAPGMGGDGR